MDACGAILEPKTPINTMVDQLSFAAGVTEAVSEVGSYMSREVRTYTGCRVSRRVS